MLETWQWARCVACRVERREIDASGKILWRVVVFGSGLCVDIDSVGSREHVLWASKVG